MFVLASSSQISKAVGIHQHSNNVTWHCKKPFATTWNKGEGGEVKASAVFFCFVFGLTRLSGGASGGFFFFVEIQKQIDCEGSGASAGLQVRRCCLIVSLSPLPTTPGSVGRLQGKQ